MAIPPAALRFAQGMDPHEQLDWLLSADGLLEEGETIASYELALLPEAVALGLVLMSGDGRDHELTDDARGVRFWTAVQPANQANAAFDNGGLGLPGEVTIVTSSIPARTRNRTFLIQVGQL